MSRNTFIVCGLPLLFILAVIPNLSAVMGAGALLSTGAAALLATWFLVWLRADTVKLRREFSVLVILPFLPDLLNVVGLPLYGQGVPSLLGWIHALMWLAAAAIVIFCLRNSSPKDEGTRFDGIFVLLSTLTAALALIQCIQTLYPATGN